MRGIRAGWALVAVVAVALTGCISHPPESPDPAPPVTEPNGSMRLVGIEPQAGSGATSNVLLRGPDTDEPGWSGTGEVRITCGTSHFAYDDPIVSPGEPGAAHLHTFIGNAGTDANSTYESLRAEPDGSTCAGGSANKSAYWMPSLIDGGANEVVEPTLAFVYYKTGYWGQDAESIRDIPNGLRMVSGVGSATAPQPEEFVRWSCASHDGDGVPQETRITDSAIPDCRPGELLDATVIFPQCWNGTDLDSEDHTSHLTHPEFDGTCPPGYPVLLPQITLQMTWSLGASGTEGLYLSNDMMTPEGAPPGQGLHADFMDAWTPELRERITTNCLNNRLDCGVRSLGDGFTLLDP